MFKSNLKNIIVIIFIIGLLFFSFLLGKNSGYINNNNNNNNNNTLKTVQTGSIISISFTGYLDNKQIIDSSGTGSIDLTIGNGSFSKFIENKLIGKKEGELIKIQLSPSEAFGEKIIEENVPKESFVDKIERTIDKSYLDEYIYQKINKNELKTVYKVGDKIKLDQRGTIGEIVESNSDSYLLKIPNIGRPFVGKKLKVGLEDKLENGANVKILSIEGNNIKLQFDNISNPFRGKKIEIGTKGKIPGTDKNVEIIRIDGNNVKIRYENPSRYAGENVNYDIKILKIK